MILRNRRVASSTSERCFCEACRSYDKRHTVVFQNHSSAGFLLWLFPEYTFLVKTFSCKRKKFNMNKFSANNNVGGNLNYSELKFNNISQQRYLEKRLTKKMLAENFCEAQKTMVNDENVTHKYVTT
jgi:hypothetical protein